jgi:hypothetical protein
MIKIKYIRSRSVNKMYTFLHTQVKITTAKSTTSTSINISITTPKANIFQPLTKVVHSFQTSPPKTLQPLTTQSQATTHQQTPTNSIPINSKSITRIPSYSKNPELEMKR